MKDSGYRFFSDFDSGNLCKVEEVSRSKEDAEFCIWTKPDCYQTQFQAGNTGTWFYFGMEGGQPGAMIKFNIMNIGRQTSLFSQGMRPVCLVTSESNQWKRISEDPTITVAEEGCILSFVFRNPQNTNEKTYLALTYPYQYEELQDSLGEMDERFNGSSRLLQQSGKENSHIYFHRETVIKSLENRNLDLLTITDLHGIKDEVEENLEDLFPDESKARSCTFENKEIVFVSSRVHPGETCASFVMQGFIDFLLCDTDEQAIKLREKYVFKILPMLNPDGVAKGHYRNDTRGVNLNRVYENPSKQHSPTIFAARKLIDYYNFLNRKTENPRSSIFLYIDIHGHATERGIFVHGNHSDNTEFRIETLLFPKLISLNSPQFSYSACKTTNMTLNDLVNGTNLDGCGRAYAHRATGLAQAYTLECSFNGGDTEEGEKEIYTPEIYSEFGKSLAVSILDLTESNPNSKIQETSMKNLHGVRLWVSKKIKAMEIGEASRKQALGKLLSFLSAKKVITPENNTIEQDAHLHDKNRRRSSGFI